ncbi:hypothetical protein [Pseudomonas veronii]|uniref:hypothetical protein n=1 Tax=Pseudomonas veronii TaxID=76761 RepID=UPI001232710A|nr:hypothetical protein [Pseudomonas veronii]KAA6177284.1 hypothetical protein F3K54_12130 [Pseudomonas veronii]
MDTPSTYEELLPPVKIHGIQAQIPEDIERPENPNGPADGGIGLRHVEHPLVVHMDRPDGTPPGTEFRLYWGNENNHVAYKRITEADEGLTYIPLTVFKNHIREYWAESVFVEVERPSGNLRKTQPLRLRINLQRPGGRDLDHDLPGNQNLIFELPTDVLRDGVNDEIATRGFEVLFRQWLNMSAYDQIVLAWGSQTVTHRVTLDEVQKDIKVRVNYPTIDAAGNGETIPVAFQVIGPTGNYPDEWAPWSAITLVDVHLNTQRPEAPKVVFPITERDIDLEELDNRNVKIQFEIDESDARNYSLVTLIWAGVDSEGNSVPATPSQAISGEGTYEFEIDNALVTAIAKGTSTVHYLLQGALLPDKRSYNRHLRVIGEITEWLAPTIDQQIGDDVDPNLPKITIRFPAQMSWQPSNTLSVTMLAASEEDTVEYTDSRLVEELPPDEDVTFDVPQVHLRRFNNRLTEVFYSIDRGSEPSKESLRRTVQVGEIKNPFKDDTNFDNHNWNSWTNKVSGRGELVIDGAENVCWKASKTSSEIVEPGLQKIYDHLNNDTQDEVSFYCKTSGNNTQPAIRIEFSGMTVIKMVIPNRNWVRFSHVFTTGTLTPDNTHTAKIYFSVNTTATFLVDQIQLLEIT